MDFGKPAILLAFTYTETHETFFEMVGNSVTALCKINDLQTRANSSPALCSISNQGYKEKTG